MFKEALLLVCCTILFMGGIIRSEQVEFSGCDDEVTKCQVYDVHIDPCPEAATKKACTLRKGKSAGISFNFNPEFAATDPKVRIYWASGVADLPFLGMNTDACKVTTCPIESNKNATLLYNLEVSRKFPTKLFDIKIKLWNENDDLCCFKTQIKLVKA